MSKTFLMFIFLSKTLLKYTQFNVQKIVKTWNGFNFYMPHENAAFQREVFYDRVIDFTSYVITDTSISNIMSHHRTLGYISIVIIFQNCPEK